MTPASQGYRMPAEWDAHAACWLGWPSHADLWEERLADAQREVADLAAAIAWAPEGTAPVPVDLLVWGDDADLAAAAATASLPVRRHRMLFGDIWMRDTLPLGLVGPQGPASVRFRFNGWGAKYDLPGDADLAERVQALWPGPAFVSPLVCEGGAVEIDGRGTCLTTRSCLLSHARNPGLAEAEVSRLLTDALGTPQVLWLDEGLLNDHTDGHIDTLVRFVAPSVVVCMAPTDEADPNRDVLRAIERDLHRMHDADGRRLTVLTVPSAGALAGDDGRLLPGSHVNAWIGEHSVVVPVYGTDHDAAALESWTRIAAAYLPGRRVVASSARALLEGGGAFHCITQQLPRTESP